MAEQIPRDVSRNFPRIVQQTEKWLVVDKPAGWLTVPPSNEAAMGGAQGVLSAWIREWAESHGTEAHSVHRIDRETSGLVLFARTREAHREANGWFERHEVKKEYDCLAKGAPGRPVWRVNAPVGGQPSVTQVEVREKLGALAFLSRARPMSGRRHQIRVHLASLGHPLLGDPEYGGPGELGGISIPRVALHAARLELPSGERFEAEWPADFQRWVEAFREKG